MPFVIPVETISIFCIKINKMLNGPNGPNGPNGKKIKKSKKNYL